MTIHVVGAGLAGLNAALQLVGRGRRVVVHEAAARAGGRCRSWHDDALGATIDNGAHVVVGANRAVRRYLATTGSADSIAWLEHGIEMLDLRDGARRRFAAPTDILRGLFESPGTRWRGVRQLWRLLAGRDDRRLGPALDPATPLARALWRPLAIAVMNIDPDRAAAGPFARTLRRTLMRGGAGMRVGVAGRSLAASFVDPALRRLEAAGAELRFGARLDAVVGAPGEALALGFGADRITLAAADRVILALPPWELARLLPSVTPTHGTSAIVNLHVRLPRAASDASPRLIGLIGGTAEWIVTRDTIACATLSAADAALDAGSGALRDRLWRDVARTLGLDEAQRPPMRLVKERRATPAQTPAFEKARPGCTSPWRQLFLAGDWVEPGLPCTIEAALRSGAKAARAALRA